MQHTISQSLDKFNDATHVPKLYVPAMNEPSIIVVRKCPYMVANKSTTRRKSGLPMGAKDNTPKTRRFI